MHRSDNVDRARTLPAVDLLEAVEDYELALSRLAWARDCGCSIAGEQADAIDWLCRDCDESLAAMTALSGSGWTAGARP